LAAARTLAQLFASSAHFEKSVLISELFEIVHRPDVTVSEVVLVVNNAIVHGHTELLAEATKVATAMLAGPPMVGASPAHLVLMRYLCEEVQAPLQCDRPQRYTRRAPCGV
jgi:hypothetical protein